MDKTVVVNRSAHPLMWLGVLLVLLKVLGVINLSWWAVTAPFWIGLALGLILIAGGGALFALAYIGAIIADSVTRWNRRRKYAKLNVRK